MRRSVGRVVVSEGRGTSQRTCHNGRWAGLAGLLWLPPFAPPTATSGADRHLFAPPRCRPPARRLPGGNPPPTGHGHHHHLPLVAFAELRPGQCRARVPASLGVSQGWLAGRGKMAGRAPFQGLQVPPIARPCPFWSHATVGAALSRPP